MPMFGFYAEHRERHGHAYGGKWYDQPASRRWPPTRAGPDAHWQKSFVDAIGYDKLQKFAAKLARATPSSRPPTPSSAARSP